MTTTTSSKEWHILRNNGARLTFQGLAKLQELISNNEVSVEDLLSRDGKKWKRLGDIAELGGLFAEAVRRRAMPFGTYDGPPQTMVMPTMAEPQPSPSTPRMPDGPPATLLMPTMVERQPSAPMPVARPQQAAERPPSTLTMPTHIERPGTSPSQDPLEGRDMEYTSKAGRVAPKDVPPQTMTAVSRAPVVFSEQQKPSASPSAIKGVQGFQVREEPAPRYLETPKLPFATTAPPEARERLAAATPTALRAQKEPSVEQTLTAPRAPAPSPSGVTETGAYTASRITAPSGRFAALRPGASPSGAYAPKPVESFPARPASPQIPRGQSGSFPVPRSVSGTYRVAETNEQQQDEGPLSTLRFHSAAEPKSEDKPPSTLKIGGDKENRDGAESPLATVRMGSGRFLALQSNPSAPVIANQHPSDDAPELERTDTLRYGPGHVAADVSATIRQMPSIPEPEDEKQKTTLQGVGAVPARKKANEEAVAPYFTDSPSSLVSISPELTERPKSSISKSGEYRRVDASKIEGAKSEERDLAEPVIHRLTSSPLFEKKSKEDSLAEPPISAPAVEAPAKPQRANEGPDNWQMGAKPTEEDTLLVPNRKSSALPWVIAAIAVGAAALLLVRPALLFGPAKTINQPAASAPNKQQQLAAEGESLLQLDDDESLRKAQAKFLQALGGEESYTPALRGLVLSYTILAMHIEQEQQLEALRAETLPKEEAEKLRAIIEANQKKGEPKSLLTEASPYAEKLASNANELDVQAALGEFQFATNDPKRSATLQQVNKYPGSWQEKWLLALEASRDDSKKAEGLLRDLLEQKPDMLRARYLLAALLLRDGQRKEARAQAEAIQQANPKHARAGQLLSQWGDEEPSSEPAPAPSSEPTPPPNDPTTKPANSSDTEPAKTPKTPSEWVQEGDRKMKAGRIGDAISDYLEASSLDRRHLPAYLKAGAAYMKQKGPSSAAYACSQYKSAISISADNADAIFGLAQCSLQMGNTSEAIKRYQQYIELYPQGQYAETAKKKINDLTKPEPTPDPTPTSTPSQ